jgi:hypothetical protein
VVDKEDPNVWYYAMQGPHMQLKDGAVMKFTNNGSDWSYLGGNKEGDDQGFPRGAAPSLLVEYGEGSDRTLYVTNYNGPAGNGGIYRKVNDDTFELIFRKGQARALAQRDDFSSLYLGADGRGLFKVTWNGDEWTNERLCTAEEGCGSIFYAMKTGHESEEIYVATDIGLLVIDQEDNVFVLKEGNHYWDVAINPHNEDILYLASDHGDGVLRSEDRGITWKAVCHGLPTLNTMRLALDPQAQDTLYVGTKSTGIWKRDFAE